MVRDLAMNSNYNELKDLPQLRGSLNTIVSIKTNAGMRRPPSLSESYAWDPDNIERLHYVQQQEQQEQQQQALRQSAPPAPDPPPLVINYPDSSETIAINFILRLLFHISLISIFESIFFFFYVSTLEDNGILNVVGGFISSAVQSCSNTTSTEREWANEVLLYVFNVSQIDSSGNNALAIRSQTNNLLMNRSWYYVGGCSGLFVACLGYSQCRQICIYWKKLLLENFAMILLLATYEYMFFSTIIKPYTPISGDEIAQRAVHQLNASCGLF
jgi:hypothetical protein